MYKKKYLSRFGELKTLAPDTFDAFVQFDQAAMANGSLSKKLKELIAVAAAHTTGCPYCIEVHVNAAKNEGASLEEIVESTFIATALKAGSALAHSVNALNAYDDIEDSALYKSEYISRLDELNAINKNPWSAFVDFDMSVMKQTTLSVKDKELIAVAVAHITTCPYCIDGHIKNAKKQGASKEEIAESIFVAAALKAGAAAAHAVNALNAYDN